MCRRQRFSTHTRGSPVAVANVRLNISPSNASSSSGVTSGGGDLMSPMRPRSDGVAARTPCWSRACANRPARRSASRLAQRKRERGRQTTAILVTIRQPSGARVRCSASAEGATSSSAGLRSHPAAFRAPDCRRSGPSTAALLVGVSGAAARRASVRPIAGGAQPRSPAPESEESYPRDDAANGKQRRLNRATHLAPLQTLSCCVPLSGKAAGSMREVFGAGIRSRARRAPTGPAERGAGAGQGGGAVKVAGRRALSSSPRRLFRP